MTSVMQLLRRATSSSSFVVGLLLSAAVTLATQSTDTLHYAVREEIAVGSVIADIVTDAGLHVHGVDVRTPFRTTFNARSPVFSRGCIQQGVE